MLADNPVSELTCWNLAAFKSLLIQHFDLHVVSNLQGTNISIPMAGSEETMFVLGQKR